MTVHLQEVAARSAKDAAGTLAQKAGAATEPPESATCVICLNAEPTHLLAPCGHQCVCAACCKMVLARTRQCPVCRQPCRQAVRVFK